MDTIYWVNCRYKLIIYRHLDGNKISVIKDNTFNNLPSLTTLWVLLSIISVFSQYINTMHIIVNAFE